jgi:hypothetical protein
MGDGHRVFPAMDMHFRLGEIRNSAGMIPVEMREQEMSHVIRRETQRLHLLERRLGRVEPRRGLPDPAAAEAVRLRDIVEPKAGVDKSETVVGLDQQTVANHPRPLPDTARTIHETPPDRAHRAGVEMMDAHRKLLC